MVEPTFNYVGLVVRRDRKQRQIWISQTAYVTKVLARFGMEDSSRKVLPMQSNWRPHERMDTEEACDQALYRQAIGSLLYAALGSRPDIAYTVSVLGRYAANPSAEHWGAVKHLLRYLNGTRNYELAVIRKEHNLTGNAVIAYSDADHAGDQDRAKSTSGWLVFFDGALIMWKSKKQGLVAHSTMEAELIGMEHAYRQASWLRDLVKEIRSLDQAVILRGDNKSGTDALNNGFPNATRHLRVRYHAIRDQIESGNLVLEHVGSDEQLADGLTKPLGSVKHAAFVKEMGLAEKETGLAEKRIC
jgi:hypothetical protein